MAPVLTAEHLEKRYGTHVAVSDVSFSVDDGEIFGILGPNGAGNTTTVECLQGLRKPDGGHLEVLGLDPGRDAAQLRKRIGSQLQESALPDRIRVGEALGFFSSLAPAGPPWETVMDEWGLGSKRSSTFASLSGGQQQRLFVALALVNDPELVFLDEMTTGLDPSSRRVAWDLIRQIRDGGATVVLVTHFMDEAENLCDRVGVIVDGHVAAIDTPDGLIARYAGEAEVTFSTDAADIGFISEVAGVDGVERVGRRVAVSGRGALLAHVAAVLVEHGLAPIDLEVRRASLEDAYLRITGAED